MHKAKAGQVTQGADHCRAEPVKAGIAHRKRLVDAGGHVPIARVSVASFPGYTVLRTKLGIECPDSQSFHAAQFLDGPTGHIHIWEPHLEHAPSDVGPPFLVRPHCPWKSYNL